MAFPCRSPTKQRLTASRPDAMLVTELPTKRIPFVENATDAHPRYASRSWTGCRGDGGLSATAPAYQPSSRVRNHSQLIHNQRHIYLVEVKSCEDTKPRRPPSNSTTCSVNISAKLPPTLASTLSSWEWVALFTALTVWSLF